MPITNETVGVDNIAALLKAAETLEDTFSNCKRFKVMSPAGVQSETNSQASTKIPTNSITKPAKRVQMQQQQKRHRTQKRIKCFGPPGSSDSSNPVGLEKASTSSRSLSDRDVSLISASTDNAIPQFTRKRNARSHYRHLLNDWSAAHSCVPSVSPQKSPTMSTTPPHMFPTSDAQQQQHSPSGFHGNNFVSSHISGNRKPSVICEMGMDPSEPASVVRYGTRSSGKSALSHNRLRTALLGSSSRASFNHPTQAFVSSTQKQADSPEIVLCETPNAVNPLDISAATDDICQPTANSLSSERISLSSHSEFGARPTDLFTELAVAFARGSAPMSRPPSASQILRRASCEQFLKDTLQGKSVSEPQSPDFRHRHVSFPQNPCRLPMKKRKVDWNQLHDNFTDSATVPQIPGASSLSIQSTSANKQTSKINPRSLPSHVTQNPLVIDCPVGLSNNHPSLEKRYSQDISPFLMSFFNTAPDSTSSDYRPRSIPPLVSSETLQVGHNFTKSVGERMIPVRSCDNVFHTSRVSSSAVGSFADPEPDHLPIGQISCVPDSRVTTDYTKLSLLARTLTSMAGSGPSSLSKFTTRQYHHVTDSHACVPEGIVTTTSAPMSRKRSAVDAFSCGPNEPIICGAPSLPTFHCSSLPRQADNGGSRRWSSTVVPSEKVTFTPPIQMKAHNRSAWSVSESNERDTSRVSSVDAHRGQCNVSPLSKQVSDNIASSDNWVATLTNSVTAILSQLDSISTEPPPSSSNHKSNATSMVPAGSDVHRPMTDTTTSDNAQILMMLSPTVRQNPVNTSKHNPPSIHHVPSCVSESTASLQSILKFSNGGTSGSFPLLLVSASSSAGAAALAAAAAVATGAPPSSLVPVPVQLTAFVPASVPLPNGIQSSTQSSISNTDSLSSPRFMLSLRASPTTSNKSVRLEEGVQMLPDTPNLEKGPLNTTTYTRTVPKSSGRIPMQHATATAHLNA